MLTIQKKLTKIINQNKYSHPGSRARFNEVNMRHQGQVGHGGGSNRPSEQRRFELHGVRPKRLVGHARTRP